MVEIYISYKNIIEKYIFYYRLYCNYTVISTTMQVNGVHCFIFIIGENNNQLTHHKHCWIKVMTSLTYGGPRQNGRHFEHNIFKFISVYENCSILFHISQKFIPILHKNLFPWVLHQIRYWLHAKQVTSHYLKWWRSSLLTYIYIYTYGSIRLSE